VIHVNGKINGGDVQFVLDTGSRATILPEGMLQELGLTPCAEAELYAFNYAKSDARVYCVTMTLFLTDGSSWAGERLVLGAPRSECILGMRELCELRFGFDGPSKRFNLVLPSRSPR
jgi:predicted aspartyl protease